jgi:hypothetical protein
MADMHDERKHANAPLRDDRPLDRPVAGAQPAATYTKRRWWPILLLALLAVGALALFTRNRGEQVASRERDETSLANGVGAQSTAGGEVADAGGMLPVAAILGNAAQYDGQTVSGTARVVDVPSDRGFWVEDNGQRLLVVLGEKGAGTNAPEHHTDIKTGQTLRLSGHVFRKGAQVPGNVLDAETRRMAENQAAFLHVNPQDVQMAR